jgi:hypothetical protein
MARLRKRALRLDWRPVEDNALKRAVQMHEQACVLSDALFRSY